MFRSEILIALIALGYVSFYPLYNGEFEDFLIRLNILLPFFLVWASMCLISLGAGMFIKVLGSVTVLFSGNLKNYAGDNAISNAIWFSYVSSFLWVLYAISVTPYDAEIIHWKSLFSAASTSILYGFLLSEFVLRPIKIRAKFINS